MRGRERELFHGILQQIALLANPWGYGSNRGAAAAGAV